RSSGCPSPHHGPAPPPILNLPSRRPARPVPAQPTSRWRGRPCLEVPAGAAGPVHPRAWAGVGSQLETVPWREARWPLDQAAWARDAAALGITPSGLHALPTLAEPLSE